MGKQPTSAGTEDELGHYECEATTYFACQADQRFGYYLYVPRNFAFDRAAQYDLCVVVHGTGRTPAVYRDLFAPFAERNNSIVVAPMFPAGIDEPRELAAYKFLERGGLRYDELLLAMIDEIAARYRLPERRFLAFGFSGGAHFVHRFAYVHPERLLGLSIGAPGMVTLLDPERGWWRGIRDLRQRFGKDFDLDALRRVPVQMIVGENDTETWEITIQPGSRFWMEGANDAGRTRIDRLRSLKQSFEEHGISVRLDIVEGIGHEGYKVVDTAAEFFASVLDDVRGGGREVQE